MPDRRADFMLGGAEDADDEADGEEPESSDAVDGQKQAPSVSNRGTECEHALAEAELARFLARVQAAKKRRQDIFHKAAAEVFGEEPEGAGAHGDGEASEAPGDADEASEASEEMDAQVAGCQRNLSISAAISAQLGAEAGRQRSQAISAEIDAAAGSQ